MARNEQQHDKYNVPEAASRRNEVRAAVHGVEVAIFNANSPYRVVGHEAVQEMLPNPAPTSVEQEPKAPVQAQPEAPAPVAYRQPTDTELAQRQVSEAYTALNTTNVPSIQLPKQSIAEFEGVDSNV